MPTSSIAVRWPALRVIGALLAGILPALLPASADAQTARPRSPWTIELYGGGSATSGSSTGAAITSFSPGSPFTLTSGRPSRAVSSWYFGDGATLLNQILTQFSSMPGSAFPRIVALDAALVSSVASRSKGGAFGARVGRDLTFKLGLEIEVERGLASSRLTDAVSSSLKASSDSFDAALRGLLNTAPLTSLTVNSTLTIPDVSNHQTRIAGALKWTVFKGNRLEGYLTGGGGVLISGGKAPEATLSGRYTFRLFGNFPMDETDTVVLRVTQPKKTAMGLLGCGLTYGLSKQSGLRADIRLHLNSNGDLATLSATPLVAALSPTSVLATAAATSPGLQFSTQPGVRSTLSGPSANLTLFTSSGLNRQISFTLGVFRRF